MLFLKIKDKRIRESVKRQEILDLSTKLVKTQFACNKKNWIFTPQSKNTISQKNSSKTKIVRRCIMHNRARSSTRSFGISRIKFRELLQFGIIPGYKKSVW